MRKKRLMSIFALLALTAGLSFTMSSCGDDDDDNGKEPNREVCPVSLPENVRYVVTERMTNFDSFEFTDHNRFIVTMFTTVEGDGNSKSRMQKASSNAEPKIVAIQGTYTLEGNVYTLENFCKLTVVTNAKGEVEKITIISEENSLSLSAKAEVPGEKISDATKNLCQEWNIDSIAYTHYYKGKVTQSGVGTARELAEKFPEEFDEFNPVSVNFTMNGTYLVNYLNEYSQIARWRWTDSSQNAIQYCWEYDRDKTYWENKEESGIISISYENNIFTVYEEYEDSESKDTYKYYLSAIK